MMVAAIHIAEWSPSTNELPRGDRRFEQGERSNVVGASRGGDECAEPTVEVRCGCSAGSVSRSSLSESEVEQAIARGREHTLDSATSAARRLLAGMP
jgi:hypothetical protein